jgi:hypothetical protein
MARLGCATLVLAASVLVAPLASAFELKHTGDGKTVKWGVPNVAFVIDPTVDAAVPGGSAAVSAAVGAWSGVGGAPALTSSVGPGGARVAFDGQNSVVYMPHGFAPAGHALAVTVSTIDDDSGDLLDTDIVFNGVHPFAVLAAGTTDPDAAPMPTDGAGGDGDDHGSFDLQHVAAHEVGHAMGLADVHDDQGALMYAMTAPGSADDRAPSSDDEAGIEQLYAGAFPSAPQSSGCGQGTVAGAHAHTGQAWLAFAAVALAGSWAGSRRRRGLAVPFASAALALGALILAAPDAPAAGSAPSPTTAATARVVAVTTGEASGVLQTWLDLQPLSRSSIAACPEHARALVWGGTRGGVTQKVDGAPVPRVGDTLDVTCAPGLDPVIVVRVRPS